jgi:hypothetical protein
MQGIEFIGDMLYGLLHVLLHDGEDFFSFHDIGI